MAQLCARRLSHYAPGHAGDAFPLMKLQGDARTVEEHLVVPLRGRRAERQQPEHADELHFLLACLAPACQMRQQALFFTSMAFCTWSMAAMKYSSSSRISVSPSIQSVSSR